MVKATDTDVLLETVAQTENAHYQSAQTWDESASCDFDGH